MATNQSQCPICNTGYSPSEVNYCSTCGWLLADYPVVLGEIPKIFPERLQEQVKWSKKIWQSYLAQSQELISTEIELIDTKLNLLHQKLINEDWPEEELSTKEEYSDIMIRYFYKNNNFTIKAKQIFKGEESDELKKYNIRRPKTLSGVSLAWRWECSLNEWYYESYQYCLKKLIKQLKKQSLSKDYIIKVMHDTIISLLESRLYFHDQEYILNRFKEKIGKINNLDYLDELFNFEFEPQFETFKRKINKELNYSLQQ